MGLERAVDTGERRRLEVHFPSPPLVGQGSDGQLGPRWVDERPARFRRLYRHKEGLRLSLAVEAPIPRLPVGGSVVGAPRNLPVASTRFSTLLIRHASFRERWRAGAPWSEPWLRTSLRC